VPRRPPSRSRLAAAALAASLALGLAAATATPDSGPLSVDVVRDAFGVPHLYVDADGLPARAALAYASGWAQAEDRLFEMDLFRRAATGRLAELPALGADFLAMDLDARRDGTPRERLARELAALSDADRRVLDAYVAGVNRFIAELSSDRSRLPFEYLGQLPAPWSAADTIAIGELQVGMFGVGGGQELENARLLSSLRQRFGESEARGIFDDLVWIDDPSAPVTISPDDQTFPPDADRVQRFAPAQMALLDRMAAPVAAAARAVASEKAAVAALSARTAIPAATGHASNAIAVSGRLTASGQPILLGGPQTGLTIPSFFWEVGLHARDADLHGVAVPGAPGIAMGRTRHFAYTITSSADDDSDVYAEILDPADHGRYLHRGRSLPFERRFETFVVAGQPPVTQEFRRSVHGPVIFTDEQAGIAFTRRRALDGRLARAGNDLLKLAFASSLEAFLRVARRVEAGFNLHYADDGGNIAYLHAGRRPRRPPNTDPRLPLLGTGAQEWHGFFDKRPTVVNPRSGWIANWNNKPARGWPSGDQREFWGPIDRVQGLADELAAIAAGGKRFTVGRVSSVMRHAATRDVFARRIAPFLSAAVSGLPDDVADRARLAEASGLIDAWVAAGAPLVARDGALPYPGAALYRAFRTVAQRAVFADELGGDVHEMFYPLVNEGNQEDDHGSYGTPDALFYRALQGASAAVPLSRDYFRNVATGASPGRDEALVAALRDAIAELAARFGSDDMQTWHEPALVETYMNLGGIDVLFGATSMPRENRGSFNLLIELGPSFAGRIIVPPGESGALPAGGIASEPPHLRDQLPLYQSFAYRRIPASRAAIAAPSVTRTLVVPADL